MIDNLDLDFAPSRSGGKQGAYFDTVSQEPDPLFNANPDAFAMGKPQDKLEQIRTIGFVDTLVGVKAIEAYPRTNAPSEEPFLMARRERFIRAVMEAGKPDYAESVRRLMVTYDDIKYVEDGSAILYKLLTYADRSADLIEFVEAGDLLKDLLEIKLQKLMADKWEEAEKAVIARQASIVVREDTLTGKVSFMAPSSISAGDKAVTNWIIQNVPEWEETSKDIVTAKNLTVTFRRFLWLVNHVAERNENVMRTMKRTTG